jgi:hypothetical protein
MPQTWAAGSMASRSILAAAVAAALVAMAAAAVSPKVAAKARRARKPALPTAGAAARLGQRAPPPGPA